MDWSMLLCIIDWNNLLYTLINIIIGGVIGYIIKGTIEKKKRDLRIQEVFINKTVGMLQETAKWVDKIDSARQNCASIPEPTPTSSEEEDNKKLEAFRNVAGITRKAEEWRQGKFIYLPKDINTIFKKLCLLATSGLRGGQVDFKYYEELYRINKLLRDALEKIATKYNPLFNLDLKESVKEVEREIDFSKSKETN